MPGWRAGKLGAFLNCISGQRSGHGAVSSPSIHGSITAVASPPGVGAALGTTLSEGYKAIEEHPEEGHEDGEGSGGLLGLIPVGPFLHRMFCAPLFSCGFYFAEASPGGWEGESQSCQASRTLEHRGAFTSVSGQAIGWSDFSRSSH